MARQSGRSISPVSPAEALLKALPGLGRFYSADGYEWRWFKEAHFERTAVQLRGPGKLPREGSDPSANPEGEDGSRR